MKSFSSNHFWQRFDKFYGKSVIIARKIWKNLNNIENIWKNSELFKDSSIKLEEKI